MDYTTKSGYKMSDEMLEELAAAADRNETRSQFMRDMLENALGLN